MARPPFLTTTRSRWRGDSWASTACTLKPMSNASTIRRISEMVVVDNMIRIHGMTIRCVVDLVGWIGVQAQRARPPHPRLGKDLRILHGVFISQRIAISSEAVHHM